MQFFFVFDYIRILRKYIILIQLQINIKMA